MTIYDQDFVAEEMLQAQYSGVKDSAAENQEAVAAPSEPVEEAPQAEQILEEASPTEEVGDDKEFNFRALREELSQMKQDRDRLRSDFEALKRNSDTPRQPEPPRKRAIDEIEDTSIIEGAHLKRILAEKDAEIHQFLKQKELESQEDKMRFKYSDYDEVITKYGAPLMEKEPDLAQGFLASENKASYLYRLGKLAMQSEVRPEPVREAPQPSQRAERIVQNSRKPGTLSNPVGGGAGNLSKADYYASMSDAEFATMVTKNLEEV